MLLSKVHHYSERYQSSVVFFQTIQTGSIWFKLSFSPIPFILSFLLACSGYCLDFYPYLIAREHKFDIRTSKQ